MSLNHDFAFEGAAVPVIEDPLLGQEVGLLLGLGMLHVLLVLGQTLLLLLLRCAMVLIHLLRKEQRNCVRYMTKASVNLYYHWYIVGGQFISHHSFLIHVNISLTGKIKTIAGWVGTIHNGQCVRN